MERHRPAILRDTLHAIDLDIEILIRDVIAAGYKNDLEFFSALFDGLVALRAAHCEGETVQQCEQLLRQVCDELYQIAISRKWLKQIKTRPYKIYMTYIYGQDAHRMNEESLRGVYRLPTSEEFWLWLHRRVAFWTAEFLRRCKTRLESLAPPPNPEVEATKVQAGRRGPRPSILHRKIAEVIEAQGEDWTTETALAAICQELDTMNIAIARNWEKWNLKQPCWAQALAHDRRLVVEHLRYCRKRARK